MFAPLFLRLAWRLHALYVKRQELDRTGQVRSWSTFQQHFHAAQRYRELHRQCLARGWLAAAKDQEQSLHTALRLCQQDLTELREQRFRDVSSVRELLAEIQHLHEEFESVSINCKQHFLAVHTEPIVLGGINLGPFEVRLRWRDLVQDADMGCIDVVALQPNPAKSDSYIPHPHVKDGDLCIGDAQVPLQKALEQGRLVDAFCLVRSVLETYNRHSAYATIDEWGGYVCNNCGVATSEEDRSFCEGCDEDVCGDCIASCKHCDRYRCRSCLGRCAVCEEGCCRRCLKQSACSELLCCKDCLARCGRCGKQVALSEIEEGSRLCDTCSAAEEESDVENEEEESPGSSPCPTAASSGDNHAPP